MRIAYLVLEYDRAIKETPGVVSKIHSQIRVFEEEGHDVEIVNVPKHHSTISRILARVPFGSDACRWDSVSLEGYNLVYMRHPDCISHDLCKWLKAQKTMNPGLKVLMELPTYPYDSEMKDWFNYPLLAKDRLHRRHLADVVDRITVVSGPNEIFGVKAIQIYNGVDLSKIAMRSPVGSYDKGETMHICCVAMFSKWHGYDRMISGLAQYYASGGTRKIIFHMVGDGVELASYKKLVERFNLSENVIFHGRLIGDELKKVYDQSIAGVASLGMHRIGIETSSTLKTREYLAKGLPFVYSGKIDLFEEFPVNFCFQIPGDESAVGVKSVIEFFDNLYDGRFLGDVAQDIRAYAEKYANMSAAIRYVTRYLSEIEGDQHEK